MICFNYHHILNYHHIPLDVNRQNKSVKDILIQDVALFKKICSLNELFIKTFQKLSICYFSLLYIKINK